jgi:hypothetical protein
MCNDISEWLEPLFSGAEHTNLDLWQLMKQASKPLPQVPESDLPERLGGWPDAPDLTLAVDWVLFGQLLRHELGWNAIYPEHPAERGGAA